MTHGTLTCLSHSLHICDSSLLIRSLKRTKFLREVIFLINTFHVQIPQLSSILITSTSTMAESVDSPTSTPQDYESVGVLRPGTWSIEVFPFISIKEDFVAGKYIEPAPGEKLTYGTILRFTIPSVSHGVPAISHVKRFSECLMAESGWAAPRYYAWEEKFLKRLFVRIG